MKNIMKNLGKLLINTKKIFSKIIKKVISFFLIIKIFIDIVVEVIEKSSVLAVFFLYIFGKILVGDLCDDDLTMNRIKEQLPSNLTISSIHREDLHGFGNESIIVLAADRDMGEKVANQLLILDKVDNDILNKIVNLLGFGSNYKLSYSFSLEYLDDEWSKLGYMLEITDIIDLTNDTTKEIVVNFEPTNELGGMAGNGGYYETGIFSYSYDTHEYYLLGTYPPYERPVPTRKESIQRNYYNKNETFELKAGLNKFYGECFAKTWLSTVLIRSEIIWDMVNESSVDPHRYTISVFKPIYHSDTGTLEWNEVFSSKTDEYFDGNSNLNEYIENFLKENYDSQIEIIEEN